MSEGPDRVDLAPSMVRRERRWWPVIAALVTIAVVVLGGYVTAAALSEPAGPPVGVQGVVTVGPLSGWETAIEQPFADGAFVRLSRGSGSLDIVVVRAGISSTDEELAAWYRDQVLSVQLDELSVSDRLETARLDSGRAALRFVYIGVDGVSGGAVEGEVTLLVTSSGAGVVLDGFAPGGLLGFSISDIRTMVDAAEVAG